MLFMGQLEEYQKEKKYFKTETRASKPKGEIFLDILYGELLKLFDKNSFFLNPEERNKQEKEDIDTGIKKSFTGLSIDPKFISAQTI